MYFLTDGIGEGDYYRNIVGNERTNCTIVGINEKIKWVFIESSFFPLSKILYGCELGKVI